jgi:general secretion pathway protein G
VRKAKNTRRRGFTLIEVMLVMLILVILASLVAMALGPTQRQAKLRAAKAQIGLFEPMLDMFHQDLDMYPSTQSGLNALRYQPNDVTNPAKWNGPYIKSDIPADPWDRPYQYQSPGTHNPDSYDLWSMGPPNENTIIGNW